MPSISFRFNTPNLDEEMKAKVDSIAYVKLEDKDRCENSAITSEYDSDMDEAFSNKYINEYPIAKSFLNDALNHKTESFLLWMGKNGFDKSYSEDTQKAILFIRLTLTDFYANCLKPSSTNTLNERTPFVEYVVPIFKYYSAVYNLLTFQW